MAYFISYTCSLVPKLPVAEMCLQSICFIQEAKVAFVHVSAFLKAEHNSKKASIDAQTFYHFAIPAKLKMFKWL